MDYVQEKAELYELRKAVQSWERKVEIASMALKTNQTTWMRLRSQAAHDQKEQHQMQHPSWNHSKPQLAGIML